jgi:hypothetical protein
MPGEARDRSGESLLQLHPAISPQRPGGAPEEAKEPGLHLLLGSWRRVLAISAIKAFTAGFAARGTPRKLRRMEFARTLPNAYLFSCRRFTS